MVYLKNPTSQRSACPIHIALELLGDRWTLLVVRDLLFKGLHSYKALTEAGEGIASNILADRLQRLTQAGLVEKWHHPLDARQYEYHLTDAGFALAPTLVEMVLWSDHHYQTDAPPEIVQWMQTDRKGFLAATRKAWLQRRASATSAASK
ncbi:MAG TPA: helix-turn-helix domain-containing protein [Burkholderiaceae bacterium]|nr:helix-turn-helix domain-containing protein [Burkholderiaceae bacterium]